MIQNSNTLTYITGAKTTQVATSSSNVHTISITAAFDTVAIYDTTSGTTDIKFSATTQTGTWILDGRFANGIRVITTGATGALTISHNA